MNEQATGLRLVDRLAVLIEMARPGPVVGAGAATLVGGVTVGGILSGPVVLACLVAVLLTTGGNYINDYYDREIDRITDPDRPLQRGAVTPDLVRTIALSLFGAAGLLALSLPFHATVVVALDIGLLLAYTPYVKGTYGLGNALVAWVAGWYLVVGGAVVGSMSAALSLFPVIFFPILSREILLDVRDVDGDRAQGLDTLAIALGQRRAVAIAGCLLCVGLFVIPFPYLFGPLGAGYLLASVFAVVPLSWVIYGLWRRSTIPLRTLHVGIGGVVVALLVGAV